MADRVGMYTSASENVNNSENHNPYGIDEMPVHRKHSDAIGLAHSHTADQSEYRDQRQHDQTSCDVKGMQADE
jgi:hypothetical protein